MPTPTLRVRPTVAVEIKGEWASGWTAQPNLTPLTATQVLPPSCGQATFRWDYGTIKEPAETAFAPVSPLELAQFFVRIRATVAGEAPRTLWIGRFGSFTFDLEGTRDDAPSGTELLVAYALEHELDCQPVDTFHCEQGTGHVVVAREWSFNERRRMGLKPKGNRSTNANATGGRAHLFSGSPNVWTHADVVTYLVYFHAPLGWEIGFAGATAILGELSGVTRPLGQTLFQLLNHLLDRKRGLAWKLVATGEDDDVLTIRVISLFGSEIQLGELTFPANESPVTLELDSDIGIAQAVFTLREQARYDQIRVLGNPIRSCFTVSYLDSTLEANWTEAEEQAYKLASTAEGADSQGHDEARRSDALERVYQSHRIPSSFPWMVGDGLGTGTMRSASPIANEDGTVDTSGIAPYCNANKALLRLLPVEKSALGGGDPPDPDPEYLAPIAIVKDPGGVYHQVDLIDTARDMLSPAQVRIMDRDLAFLLKGRVNHQFAVGHFEGGTAIGSPGEDSADEETGPSDAVPEVAYETILATVACETDARIQAVVHSPLEASAPTGRILSLFIEDAHYWYVVPDTVLGIHPNGELMRYDPATEPLIGRDDTAVLRAAAELACAWYGQSRAAVRLGWEDLAERAPLGAYVAEASSAWHQTAVNSVVTRIALDFERERTELETDFTELDVAGIAAEVPGLSDLRSVGRVIRDMAREVAEIREQVANAPSRLPPVAHAQLRFPAQISDEVPPPPEAPEGYAIPDGSLSDTEPVYAVKEICATNTTAAHPTAVGIKPQGFHVLASDLTGVAGTHNLAIGTKLDVFALSDQETPRRRRFVFIPQADQAAGFYQIASISPLNGERLTGFSGGDPVWSGSAETLVDLGNGCVKVGDRYWVASAPTGELVFASHEARAVSSA